MHNNNGFPEWLYYSAHAYNIVKVFGFMNYICEIWETVRLVSLEIRVDKMGR